VDSGWCCAQDPSLRLKSGFAQDDASFRFQNEPLLIVGALDGSPYTLFLDYGELMLSDNRAVDLVW
jgi:hypothetical protein